MTEAEAAEPGRDWGVGAIRALEAVPWSGVESTDPRTLDVALAIVEGSR